MFRESIRQDNEEPWNVLLITSSCWSFVSLTKFTAYPLTRTVRWGYFSGCSTASSKVSLRSTFMFGYEECVETYTSLRETFNNPSSSQARYNSDIPAKNPRIPSHRGHLATHQGSLIKQATDVPRPQTKNNLFFPIRHWQGRTHHHSLTKPPQISHRIHITTRLKSTSITLELVMTPPMSFTRRRGRGILPRRPVLPRRNRSQRSPPPPRGSPR